MVDCRLVLHLFLVATAVAWTQAFIPKTTTPILSPTRRTRTSNAFLFMSGEVDKENAALGATERLLLEAKRRQDAGIVQDYGKTVMNDGLDGVRAIVWALFGASQVVFTVLAIGLVAGLGLNLAGLGYYWDDHLTLHIDTLNNIHQMRLFEAEMARMTSEVVTKGGVQ